MDSVTQFALGATVGTLALGARIGPRRAALFGGILAMLPDLDILLPAADPVEAFVNHRGFSHSVVVLTIVAPVAGEALRLVVRRLRDARLRCYLAVWLILVTHALLDAFTTYGTRILWPLSDHPVSFSTIFIIDPAYTLPLLIATIIALTGGRWRPTHAYGARLALLLSSLYLAWTVVAQQIAERKVLAALERHGVRAERLAMIPMPFNSFLWRGLAVEGDRYYNVYRSVLDTGDAGGVHAHERRMALADGLPDQSRIAAIADFSGGFYAFRRVGDELLLSDLRLGVEPNYVFTFRIAEFRQGMAAAVFPVRMPRGYDLTQLGWLWRRIFDETAPRKE
ncbi:MAG: metal-dependent hydrolase [Alphaproteobacteria bacterium]|nr:metal-dependent hydrolase [Alphaproteobacteria bacterium]